MDRSFHYAMEKWGIYMLDKGVYILAEEFAKQYRPNPLRASVEGGDAVAIYYHELFHSCHRTARILEKQRYVISILSSESVQRRWVTKNGDTIPHKLNDFLANEVSPDP